MAGPGSLLPSSCPAAGSRAGQNLGLPPLCLATAPQGTERRSHGHSCYAHPLLLRMHISATLKCLLLWPLPWLTHRHTSKLSQGEEPLFACLRSPTASPLEGARSSLTPGWARLKGGRASLVGDTLLQL